MVSQTRRAGELDLGGMADGQLTRDHRRGAGMKLSRLIRKADFAETSAARVQPPEAEEAETD